MKAAVLVRKGDAARAFEMREVETPTIKAGEVLIEVEGFGLNFADVMARLGIYADAPAMPSIIGYDVVGRIVAIAAGVNGLQMGDRVTAMTHFGGYAQYATTDARAVAKIADSTPLGEATALTTQYCTAYYAAAEMVQLHPGDRVLIHSAAGGVGTALLQYAHYQGCEIYATAGSPAKIKLLEESGVHHAINYSTQDFAEVIHTKTNGAGVDVIFDAVGGSYVSKGFKALAPGGRLVCYGGATISDKNIFGKINALLAFGFYHPLQLLNHSKSILGVNMLRIADHKPQMLKRCLDQVVKLYEQGVFKPMVGGVFNSTDLAVAHSLLENRKSTGKITVQW